MLVHFVVTLAVTVVACLMCWAVFHTLRRPMPRYLLPLIAGSVAIGYGIQAEYTWGSRTAGVLPDSFAVLREVEDRSVFAPWTWLVPKVVRFSAVDTAAIGRHPSHPDLRLVDVLLFERFHPVRRVPQLIDCAGERRADPGDGRAFTVDGLPEELVWRAFDEGDALPEAVCGTA